MEKQNDVMAILKLYELRREPEMRAARQWFFSSFAPVSAMDIIALYRGGERASANFRMITSYWDMAASFVNHGAIDEEMFADAHGEHIVVFAKVEPFLAELREITGNPKMLENLEKLVMRMPDAEERLAKSREIMKRWMQARAQMPGN